MQVDPNLNKLKTHLTPHFLAWLRERNQRPSDEEVIAEATALGWRREGSLWREPKGAKAWAWDIDALWRNACKGPYSKEEYYEHLNARTPSSPGNASLPESPASSAETTSLKSPLPSSRAPDRGPRE
jgi:hypothetical protein